MRHRRIRRGNGRRRGKRPIPSKGVWAEDCYFLRRRPDWYVDATDGDSNSCDAIHSGRLGSRLAQRSKHWCRVVVLRCVDELQEKCGLRKVKYAPGGDIQVIKSLDGIQWSAPKTILTQAAESNHLPKLVANQLAVHEPTGHWVLPMWRDAHSTTCKPSVSKGTRTSAGVYSQKIKANRGQSLVRTGREEYVGSSRHHCRGWQYERFVVAPSFEERNIYTNKFQKTEVNHGRMPSERAFRIRTRR